MREVRLCTRYLLQGGRVHVIRTGWLRDTPESRAQIEEMTSNARRFSVVVECWTEDREITSAQAEALRLAALSLGTP